MIVNSKNIRGLMWDAVKEKNEALIKEIIIEAMEIFLKNKDFSKEDLDDVASTYIVVPIHEPDVEDIEFKDAKLRYVLEELSAIETISDLRTHDLVKRFILFLEGKNYEKIDYFKLRREGGIENPELKYNQTLLDEAWGMRNKK